mgnify:CR=1 FL=1
MLVSLEGELDLNNGLFLGTDGLLQTFESVVIVLDLGGVGLNSSDGQGLDLKTIVLLLELLHFPLQPPDIGRRYVNSIRGSSLNWHAFVHFIFVILFYLFSKCNYKFHL